MSKPLTQTALSVTLLVGGGVAALMVGCYGSGMLLSDTVVVETERLLNAPAEEVAALIRSPEGAKEWWDHAEELYGANRISERITVEAGPNSLQFLAGEQVFEQWTLVEAADWTATWDIDMKSMRSQRTLAVTPEGDGSRLTWTETSFIDSPVMRWTALLPQQNVLANFHGAMQVAESAAIARHQPKSIPDPAANAELEEPETP